MTECTRQEAKELIASLEAKKNGDVFHDMEIQDQIMEIEVKHFGKTKPEHSPIDCVGCGS